MVSLEQWQRMTPKQQWDAYVAAALVADAKPAAPEKKVVKKAVEQQIKWNDEKPAAESI